MHTADQPAPTPRTLKPKSAPMPTTDEYEVALRKVYGGTPTSDVLIYLWMTDCRELERELSAANALGMIRIRELQDELSTKTAAAERLSAVVVSFMAAVDEVRGYIESTVSEGASADILAPLDAVMDVAKALAATRKEEGNG